jgi:hypothetical protein
MVGDIRRVTFLKHLMASRSKRAGTDCGVGSGVGIGVGGGVGGCIGCGGGVGCGCCGWSRRMRLIASTARS